MSGGYNRPSMVNGASPSITGEGAGAVPVGNLDMSDERDRTMIRSKRWDIGSDQRRRYVRGLDAALAMAVQKSDHRAMNGIIRTLAVLEGQNQADEHLAIKLATGHDESDNDKPEIVVTYSEWPALPEGEDDPDG